MPRRNRNAHTATVNPDELADQARAFATELNAPAPDGSPAPSHLAIRIDALPPWSDPDDRYYWCPTCGYLTGAELPATAIAHEIPGPGRIITRRDLNLPDLTQHPAGCQCATCLLTPSTRNEVNPHGQTTHA